MEQLGVASQHSVARDFAWLRLLRQVWHRCYDGNSGNPRDAKISKCILSFILSFSSDFLVKNCFSKVQGKRSKAPKGVVDEDEELDQGFVAG